MFSKINIFYIFHVSVIGGGSFCLLNIIKQLDKNIYNPIILLKEEGPLADELKNLGATVYFEKSISTVLYNKSIFRLHSIKLIWGVLTSLPKIKKWLIELKPDIVHLNTMMLYPYLWTASHLKIKTVIHMRENWPKGEHKLQFKFARWCINKCAAKIAAINQTSADILGLNYKTEIIHDYISFEGRGDNYNFEKLFGKNYQSLKIFSFFGGTNWQKGALPVVETFASDIVDKNVRLLVIGCNSKEIIFSGFRGSIKKVLTRINYYRYSDKVKYIAQKDERIVFVPGTYHVKSIIEQSCCIVSFFSIPHANLTMAEASCLGIPSIAANTPEAKEYCNNGESALLFEMNNKNEFKQKIEYFLESKEHILEKAKAGTKKMEQLFSPEKNSELLHNLYKIL